MNYKLTFCTILTVNTSMIFNKINSMEDAFLFFGVGKFGFELPSHRFVIVGVTRQYLLPTSH